MSSRFRRGIIFLRVFVCPCSYYVLDFNHFVILPFLFSYSEELHPPRFISPTDNNQTLSELLSFWREATVSGALHYISQIHSVTASNVGEKVMQLQVLMQTTLFIVGLAWSEMENNVGYFTTVCTYSNVGHAYCPLRLLQAIRVRNTMASRVQGHRSTWNWESTKLSDLKAFRKNLKIQIHVAPHHFDSLKIAACARLLPRSQQNFLGLERTERDSRIWATCHCLSLPAYTPNLVMCNPLHPESTAPTVPKVFMSLLCSAHGSRPIERTTF